jgi:2-polyprenyl-3-methyl-5-hydroxy-6-metoxy-1,4-benzoquinol methylase
MSATETTGDLDETKVEAFGQRIVDALNESGLMLAVSIGYRAKLFDQMAEMPPATSQEIADTAGLNERYVREWLGTMVTGRVVDYDPQNKMYSLAPEHAACLTRAVGGDNLAMFAQYIPMMAQVEEPILECFQNGGGVPYSMYPRFHEVMAEESALTVVAALVSSILPLVPGLPERLEHGIDVMDIGCGSGRALNQMARSYPNSRFVGYDLSAEGVAAGQAMAAEASLDNLRFEVKDATNIGEFDAFDLVTAFDAIHDQAQPAKVLEGIATALRPDGTFLMQDIAGSSHVENNMDHPMGPFMYTVSMMHCMTVSLAQDGGVGLGAMWGEELALQLLKEAGFASVNVKQLPHDFQNNYFVSTKT